MSVIRIPRKIKKKYKKIWSKRMGYRFKIQKLSIEKDKVWGCITYPYNEKI